MISRNKIPTKISTYTYVSIGSVSEDAVSFCERFLELVTDLEAQLPTRRFFNTLLSDMHFLVCGPYSPPLAPCCESLSPSLPPSLPPSPSLSLSLLKVRCYISSLAKREPEGHLFKQLLERLKFYSGFEINDQTGSPLTDHEMTDIHYDKITSLQRAAFKLFPDLRNFALSNVAGVDTRGALCKHFTALR